MSTNHIHQKLISYDKYKCDDATWFVAILTIIIEANTDNCIFWGLDAVTDL